jgi:hypothetical protein
MMSCAIVFSTVGCIFKRTRKWINLKIDDKTGALIYIPSQSHSFLVHNMKEYICILLKLHSALKCLEKYLCTTSL